MAQEEILDFVVVGAGPAGLQAAYCLAGGSATFRVLEGSEYVGNFYHHNPRHGKLISINKTHNMCQHVDYSLRHDWNSLLCDDPTLVFPEFTEEFFPPREVLVEYMEAFATKLDLRKHISFNERVTKATKDKDGIFTVTSTSLTLRCRALLMATGAVAEHCPDIPGLDVLPTYGTHNLDTKKYRRKKVLIIGKGNSAFECADHLSAAAGNLVVLNRTPVKFAWDTHFVGHLRAVNNNFLDMVRLKSNHRCANVHATRSLLREGGLENTTPDNFVGICTLAVTVRLQLEFAAYTTPGDFGR